MDAGRDRMAGAAFAAFAACFFPVTVLAQSSTDVMPLGLEKLRWGMTISEAQAQYRLLGPETALPPGTPMTNQRGTRIASYKWKGCTFEVYFYFAGPPPRESLDEIDLFQQEGDTPPCADDARADLMAHYGPADGHGSATTPSNNFLDWLSDAAKEFAEYNREHPEKAAERYQGLSAIERFHARAREHGPKANFMSLNGTLGVRVFLYSQQGEPRFIYN